MGLFCETFQWSQLPERQTIDIFTTSRNVKTYNSVLFLSPATSVFELLFFLNYVKVFFLKILSRIFYTYTNITQIKTISRFATFIKLCFRNLIFNLLNLTVKSFLCLIIQNENFFFRNTKCFFTTSNFTLRLTLLTLLLTFFKSYL